jgi:mannitol 2-dehydrogenase
MYVDRLLAAGAARDWAIAGVGVLDSDVDTLASLTGQDWLYVLALRHSDGRWDGQVVGSITQVVHARTEVEETLELLAAPATRIVSLTITEGGYNLTPDGGFDLDEPAVRADLAGHGPPRTVFGLVTAALALRRARGLPPFTVMSCDNIESNGHVARQGFLAYAGALDPSLRDWVAEHGAFPSSMVDRITPATTDEVRAQVAARYGVHDAVPVAAEPFVQWVLEDDFAQGRPPYEDAGVQLVDDVRPFELMKLRLLNGSHQTLSHLGSLLGYTYVHEAAQDPDVARFVRAYMADAARTLPHVPNTDVAAYRDQLIERFANPEILDPLARVAAFGTDRMPKFVLPVAADLIRAGGDLRTVAAVVAGWSVFCAGVDEGGRPIELTDHLAGDLRPAAAAAAAEPLAWLGLPVIPPEVRTSAEFRAAFLDAHKRLAADGVHGLAAGVPA